jgi:hypothetical protein
MPAKRRRDPDAEDELESRSEYLEGEDQLDESEGSVAVEEDASEALTQHREVSGSLLQRYRWLFACASGADADVDSTARSVVASRPMRYSRRRRRKMDGRRRRERTGMSSISAMTSWRMRWKVGSR